MGLRRNVPEAATADLAVVDRKLDFQSVALTRARSLWSAERRFTPSALEGRASQASLFLKVNGQQLEPR